MSDLPDATDPSGVQRQRSTAAVLQIDVRTIGWLLLGLLLGFGVFAVARNAEAMVTRILIGVVLALALDGVVQNMRTRFGLTRGAAVGIVGITLLVLSMLVLLVLGPPAVSQAREFSREIPQTVEQFYDLPFIGDTLRENDAAGKVQEWIRNLPANVSDKAIADTANRLVGGVFSTLIVVLTTFAVLLDGERLVNRGRRLLPVGVRDDADRIARVFHRTIGKYFGGSLTVAGLMGLFVLTIGLIFNVPLAPVAAIWAMFTDLIPQIGGFLGGAFLFILAVSNSVPTALVVTLLFIIYMTVENHLIQPAIIGSAVNLSPPTTMLAAFIGGAIAGVPGALISTPLVGSVKQLYLEFRFGPTPDDHHGSKLVRRLRGWLRPVLERIRVRRPTSALPIDPLLHRSAGAEQSGDQARGNPAGSDQQDGSVGG